MKKFVFVICCAGAISVLAGFKVPGPIQVVDACGRCRYDHVELHDIIGEIDAVEVVGCRNDVRESRGYVCSASPAWILPITNGVTRYYRILTDDGYGLKSRRGIHMSLVKGSSESDGLLMVGCGGGRSLNADAVKGLRAEDAWDRIMVDRTSGFPYRSSDTAKFDDGSGVSALVSFYGNGQGLVKVWFEIVDSADIILAKGWVRGRIEGDILVERSEAFLQGGEKAEVCLNPRKVKSLDGKDIAWLHVNLKIGNASACVGNMIRANE